MFSLIKTSNLTILKTYEQRIIKLENAIDRLNSEMLSVTTDQKIIRDKVLRKIQFKKEKEEENTEEPQTLYSNNPIFF